MFQYSNDSMLRFSYVEHTTFSLRHTAYSSRAWQLWRQRPVQPPSVVQSDNVVAGSPVSANTVKFGWLQPGVPRSESEASAPGSRLPAGMSGDSFAIAAKQQLPSLQVRHSALLHFCTLHFALCTSARRPCLRCPFHANQLKWKRSSAPHHSGSRAYHGL